jgi:hypothetical protein
MKEQQDNIIKITHLRLNLYFKTNVLNDLWFENLYEKLYKKILD